MAPDLETAIKKVSEENSSAWRQIDPSNFVMCEESTAVVIWKEWKEKINMAYSVEVDIMQELKLINNMRKDTWDLQSAASFIVSQLSYTEVEFGGGWST
jgi:hypothetical protein